MRTSRRAAEPAARSVPPQLNAPSAVGSGAPVVTRGCAARAERRLSQPAGSTPWTPGNDDPMRASESGRASRSHLYPRRSRGERCDVPGTSAIAPASGAPRTSVTEGAALPPDRLAYPTESPVLLVHLPLPFGELHAH